MSVKHQLFTVGFDKNMEADFGLRADIVDLPLEERNELRRMIVVAIGSMESMWLREQMKKHHACRETLN